ncbi:MAG: TPM domain-containing protein [Lachnospiraceae bacterium]|nr:TPM domain-containing protein [Lachnospiraceae bacterium]
MPHSSGGGSHSSGSHSSSSHGGGRSTPSVYNTYHSGTRRYVYYQNSRPHYYYSTEKVKEPAGWKLPVAITVLVILVLFCILSFYWSVITPYKLDMDYDTEIIITDNIDVMTAEEEADLTEKLKEFQEITGITPAVLTVNNEEWKPHYDSLGNYAYDYYVNNFSDECHWLIVYSTDGGTGFEDWHWEGMQGDNTDNIITSEVSDQFNAVMQKEVTARTRYTVKDAIYDSFSAIEPGIMEKSIDWENVVYTIIFAVIMIGVCISYIFDITRAKKRSNSYVCKTAEEDPLEDTCEYCGGVYVHGIHISCPHCGAPIVALKKK